MKVYNEILDATFDLASPPERVVSLLSSATETIEFLGLPEAVVGVSEYCGRYTRGVDAPVVGQYLSADEDLLRSLNPDLVLLTSGIQLKLARRLVSQGLPVYVLPLPSTFPGMLENLITVAALMDAVPAGRRLRDEVTERLDAVRRAADARPKRRTYVELWFGRHMRTIGGRSFVHDLVEAAGGMPVYGDSQDGYFVPDLDAVPDSKPERAVLFQEPEYPVDYADLCRRRGWGDDMASLPVIHSTIDRGRNVIHDGPSYVETAEWLAREMEALDG